MVAFLASTELRRWFVRLCLLAGLRRVKSRRADGRQRTRLFLDVEQLEPREVPATIQITELPTYGVDGLIRGKVTDVVDFTQYRVAPYIQIEGSGWWTKPTDANPTVPINTTDGTFEADVATGGIDNRATIFFVGLIPAGQTPHLAHGAGRVPADLMPVATDTKERYSRLIQFAGRTWAVKEAPAVVPGLPDYRGVGPGSNFFSNQPGDVFVDGKGLHLTLSFHDEKWWATEVILLDRLGFGTYSVQTNSNVSVLDPNVTFGAFTWDPYGDDVSGADPHREIDLFEDSRWGNASDPTNSQEVVQPFNVAGNLHRYTIPDLSSDPALTRFMKSRLGGGLRHRRIVSSDPALTRFMKWEQDRINFVALRGQQNTSQFPPESIIDQFSYLHNPSQGHYVPTAGRASFRFNLWLNGGGAPSNGQPVDVLITNFTFTPPPVTGPATRVIPAGVNVFAAGADASGGPDVKVFNAGNGPARFNFFPYDANFTGDVRAATGDVNADGIPDLVCAAGPGGGPNVTVFSGAEGSRLHSFFAYRQNFTAGIYAAAGDANGDGKADIITDAGAGGGPNVSVFDLANNVELLSFFAFDSAFTGGVRVAAVDRNGDGKADIVAAPGHGGGPEVSSFSGIDGSRIDQFFAYDPRFSGGLYLAGGGR